MSEGRDGRGMRPLGSLDAGEAVYASRNPLFRSPARNHNDGGSMYPLEDNTTNTTSDTTSDRSSEFSSTVPGQNQRPWPLTRSSHMVRGNRPVVHPSPTVADSDDDYNESNNGVVVSRGARMSDLSMPIKGMRNHRSSRGTAHSGGTSNKAQRPLFQSPRAQEDVGTDTRNLSDISEMLVSQKSPRKVGVERYNDVGRARGMVGVDGGDIGSSTHSVAGGRGGGGGSAAATGIEPAVKGCGCMTSSTFAKLVTVVVILYNVGYLWTQRYENSTGKLCSIENPDACVTAPASKVLITIARFTAGGLFPSIAICILSKCYATRYFLHHSWLSLIVSFEPAHDLHLDYGLLTLVFSVLHGVAHIARFVLESNPEELYASTLNRSGVAALLLLLPTAVPMSITYLKMKLKFENRKAMHMLFVPFLIAVCFHTKALRYLGAILLSWYLIDRLYFTTRMSFYIDRPSYKPVGRGTLVRFDLPPGYRFTVGAYVQVNCPIISASEWHPFSLFPVPGSRPRAGFHVEAVGDWTEELFRLGLEDQRMHLWITAAQPSVLEKSLYFDNIILVCTGAGITPAVSMADKFSRKKNVHLIWLSREASMIAMFEKQLRRVKSTVHLTGRPSAKTKQKMIDLLAPSRREVVPTVSRPSSRQSSKANSRSSSYSDLTTLEAGGLNDTGSIIASDYKGELRDDENTEAASEDGEEGSLHHGGRGFSNKKMTTHGGSHKSSRARCKDKKHRGLHPVSVNFGRPDMERYISETVQGTAVTAEWAADGVGGVWCPNEEKYVMPPAKLRQALGRLNTNQRISKKDLMSADLSVVASKPAKPASVSGASGFSSSPRNAAPQSGSPSPPTDPRTWLVLYCGANAIVEKAVATSCTELGVTWRKEYFSAW